MEPEKDAVRGYWDSRPCGTTLSDAPIGSGTFFTEVEQRRYAAEPFIRQFADFGAWRGARILEIGVGVGSDFVNFVRRGADAVGIDLTPAAISLVRRRLAIERLSAETIVADAERLPFHDRSFDLVYSWGVLHHTPNTSAAIDELRRVVRPSGQVRVMLYSRHSWVALGLWLRNALGRGRAWKSFSQVLAEYLESPGTKAYTVPEIRQMFAGFKRVTVQTFLTRQDRRVGGPIARVLPKGFYIGVTASRPSPPLLIRRFG